MNEKIIELELRAVVPQQGQEALKKRLKKIGTLHSQTKRLSVMCFGSVGRKKLDVRVRITNGMCEVVVKSGLFGSHDRAEVAQEINSTQFLGIVKIFAEFNFIMKIGERETVSYRLPDGIMVALVSAGSTTYVELEKMSSRSDVNHNTRQLKNLTRQLNLQLLGSEQEFEALCGRLTETVDWPFHGTSREYARLAKLVDRYTNFQRKSG